MTTSPLRLAITGCGAAFEHLHREPLLLAARRGWVRLVAAADPSPARRELARRWFPDVRTYQSAAELFAAEEGLDGAIVASPPPVHRTDCETAFAAGCHVLCEKPLAGSVADAVAIEAAAAAGKRRLVLGMTRRYYPAIGTLAKLLAEEGGEHARFVHRQGGVYGWTVASDAAFRRATSGGGVLLDWGVHLLDTLGLLFGWGRATAAQDDAMDDGVEANALVELDLERASGRLHLSWDTPMESALHVVTGDVEYWQPLGSIDALHRRRGRNGPWERVPLTVDWPVDLDPERPKRGRPRSHNECMTYQLIGALRCLRFGEAPAAGGADGTAAVRIVHEAYGMAEPLVVPWLSEAEGALLRERHWRRRQPAVPSREAVAVST